MATKRQGRAGIFKRATTQAPRKRSIQTGPQSALAALGGVAYTWDMVSDALNWGPNASEVLGLSPSALPRTGMAFSQMVEPGGGLDRNDAIGATEGRSEAYETRYALRFGTYKVVMVQDAGRWQPDAEGRPFFVRGVLRIDLGASALDLLPTPVKARSILLRRIQEDIDEAVRFSHTCTLIVGACDSDDSIPMEDLARRLRPMMRRGDHFAVLSPSRFALTLACCPAKEAVNAMTRVGSLLQTGPAKIALHLGAAWHLGAACSPDHTFEAMKLLRFAEEALATAIEQSEPAILHRIRHSVPPQAQTRASFDTLDALNDRRLTLTCRPIVDAQSRHPTLVQAGAGLPGADGRMIPLAPVTASDQASIVTLVDGRMLELAADHLVRFPEEHLALPIALTTLQDREWLPMLAAHLGARPGIASRLMIEVPETVLMDTNAAKGRLDAMKALGLGIGLNGFGTGHASLARLQSLPVDLVRIDGVFIQSLKRSIDDRLFVRTLIGMAHHLGFAAAAEWVDDASSADLLTAWGIDYMQGSLFGEAEAVAQPPSLLRRIKRA
jgi:EAL domain-containing protein (putative c-di-GMP-specific phosphodiesterase class I)